VIAYHGLSSGGGSHGAVFLFLLFVFVHSFLCSQFTFLVAASSQDFSDFVDGVSSASFTALAYGLVVAFEQ
jgi:succinate dehydrogenase/fumarate reductase cytochrome b subunit